MSDSDDTPQSDGNSQDAHRCPWCPDVTRGLYAVAYNAVLAIDMARAGLGDQERAGRKLAELRHYVMDVYSPQIDAHFIGLYEQERQKPPSRS